MGRPGVLLSIALIFKTLPFASAGSLPGVPCSPLQDLERARLAAYVEKRFHGTAGDTSIVQAEPTGSSCFWRVKFHAQKPARSLTLFLSPDHLHLFPDMYDVSVDPLLAEREERLSTAKSLNEGASPSRGAVGGSITIVEFADFQCPYCKKMEQVLAALVADPKQGADVTVVYKNFPLERHDWALAAAELGQCAFQLSPAAFWPMRDYLFSNQESLTADSVKEKGLSLVSQKGTPRAAIAKCMTAPETLAAIRRDLALGRKSGVSSTPTIFVNGEKFDGAQSLAQMEEILNRTRNESPKAPAAQP